MFVTVEDIKRFLYIDFEADDLLLAELIEAAEDSISRHIGRRLNELVRCDGTLPGSLLQAIKIMVANMYASRESVAFGGNPIKIPYSFEYLLQPFKNYKRN